MTSFLTALSIGPVGGFIGGGRRSRDLWWGSTWVSECTAEVARWLEEEVKKDSLTINFLLPTSQRLKDIRSRSKIEDSTYAGRVSNKILATIEAPSSSAISELMQGAEGAARSWLKGTIAECYQKAKNDPRVGRALRNLRLKSDGDDVDNHTLFHRLVAHQASFEAQSEAILRGDFLEFNAAWTPEQETFSESVKRVWQLLGGRKAARLFVEPSWSQDGRRKSDLDPGRDSVLHSASPKDREFRDDLAQHRAFARRVLGIGPDEHLDALGFARRIALFGSKEPELSRLPFPPIARVALDPWLRRANADPSCKQALVEIIAILGQSTDNELFFTWCSPARDPDRKYEKDSSESIFPFDAAFLIENGLGTYRRELERYLERLPKASKKLVNDSIKTLGKLQPQVDILYRRLGLPSPYYALLAMDGDGVGSALAKANGNEQLRNWSSTLDGFADEVEKIVRTNHGCAFYVGGDDSLAYLPLDKALATVKKLSEHFAKRMKGAGLPASLSGGLVIAHAKSDLRRVRKAAEEALADAKAARRRAGSTEGWLQISELPRSGPPRTCCGPIAELSQRFYTWSQGFAKNRLSLRTSGLLREWALRFDPPDERNAGENTAGDDTAGNSPGADPALEIAKSRIRLQRRRSTKSPADGEGEDKLTRQIDDRIEVIESWQDSHRLADELRIAARFHRAGRGLPATDQEVRS